MFTPTIVQKRTHFAEWVPGKSVRLALVLGSLVLMSIVVNALIILADSGQL